MKAPWAKRQRTDRDVIDAVTRMLADPDTGLDDDMPELSRLRLELRTAAWQRARLAALEATIGKTSHDVRGSLSPALLAAERLQANPDTAISRTGDLLIAAIERVSDALRAAVVFSRTSRIAATPTRFAVGPLIQEAMDLGCAGLHPPVLRLNIPADLEVDADQAAIRRVFTNLARNAAQARAGTVSVSATKEPGRIAIEFADDGPGLPGSVAAGLFQPFVVGSGATGAGLGLAIAHDLLLSSGGDIALAHTGPTGTAFTVSLSTKTRAARPAY